MRGKIFLLIEMIFLFSNILAICESNQIDINSASITELDNLAGIGPKKAQLIIDARPFENVDELLNANGIGEMTLQGIKEQGLACVNEKINNSEKDVPGNKTETNNTKEPIKKEIPVEEIDETPKTISANVVKLDAKSIKSTENTNNSINKYAKYGLVGFCVLLAMLFIFKAKNKSKNEFR
jgi:competence ComEA-like helix-hairpin-helix protein